MLPIFRRRIRLLHSVGICLLSFLICFFSSISFSRAQNADIVQLSTALENNSNHRAVTIQIKKLLASQRYPKEEKLALQIVLVHKYQELQVWDSCLIYCQQQVAEAQRQNNTLAEASFYKLIGNTYYHIPDKDKAVEYWKKCISISEQSDFRNLLEQCYHNIASVYLDKNMQLDLAENYFKKSIALSIENKISETEMGRLHARLLATLYERTHRFNEAARMYDDVINKSRALNDSTNLAEALMFSSELYLHQKKYDKALQLSGEALAISRAINKLDMVSTALEFHTANLYAAGNYKEAFLLKEEVGHIIEQRYNNDLNTKLSEAEAKFKTKESENEKRIALIEAQKEKQLYLSIFGGLLVLLSTLFYSMYQKKVSRQKLIVQQQMQDEKERLSRDLHDNLGSQMALLSNNIESLDINFRKQLPIDANIERIKGSSRQLLQTLRETIWILNQEQLTAEDFFDKLVDYTHRYLQGYPHIQLKVEEQFSDAYILNSENALQLFRICQEALTNACKYSESESIVLKGESSQSRFQVWVQDFGKGFNQSSLNGEDHYGLKNMQQRAASIKAKLIIDAEQGKGVTVSVLL